MLDFGSLDPGVWSDAHMWHIAYYGDDLPFGGIYYTSQATDWENLDLWAVSNEGGAMVIYGVTSEYPYGCPSACTLTPHAGYDAMLNQLQGHSSTYQSSITNLTDI